MANSFVIFEHRFNVRDRRSSEAKIFLCISYSTLKQCTNTNETMSERKGRFNMIIIRCRII